MTIALMGFGGAGILLLALMSNTALNRASASVRHLVWSTALGMLVLMPLFGMSGVRLEVPVPAALVEFASVPVGVAAVFLAEDGDVPITPSSGAAPGDVVGARGSASVAAVAPQSASAPRVAPGEAYSAFATAPSDAVAVGELAPRVGVTEDRVAGDRPATPASTPAGTLESAAYGAERSAAVGAGPTLSGASVLVAWLVGMILLLAGTLVSHLRAYVLTTAETSPAHPSARRRFHELCLELGLKRPARLVVSERLRVPATWGLTTATVVLPDGHEDWSRATLDRVLLHELAHVRRGDCWTHLVGQIARAVHWPNPLVWYALARQRAESERACDDLVLTAGAAPSEYAADLVALVRSLRMASLVPAAAQAMAGPIGVADRVRAVLDPERDRASVGRHAVLTAVMVAVVAAGAATIIVPVAAQERPVPVPPPAPPSALEPAPPSALPFTSEPALPPSALEPAAAPSPLGPAAPPPSLEPVTPTVAPALRAPAPPDPVEPRVVDTPRWVPAASLGSLQSQERCVFREGGSRSSSTSIENERTRIRWEVDGCRVDVQIDGEIEFAADDSDVSHMEPGALFEIEERVGRDRRRVRYEGESGGRIERRYWVDGEEVAFGADAEAWMATILPELFRNTTLNAPARVRRMVAEGGPERVFREVRNIHSDHVAGRYLELLMEETPLTEGQYASVIDVAGGLDSDHSTAELLLGVVARAGMRPAFQNPLLQAASTIDSDHQRTRVLQALLQSPLTPGQLNAVIRSAASIESDHQLSMILTAVAETGRLNDMDRSAFLDAIGTIDSDHQHAVVVNAFLDAGPLSDAELARVLDMTEGIESDHQRATILQRVAADYELSGPQVTAYLRSASGLESDHQIAVTAVAVVDRADFTREQLALVLTMASGVSSDHQRATILGSVVRRRDLDESEVREVLSVARGLSSEHQKAMTLTLLAEDEQLSPASVVAVLQESRRIGSSHQRSQVLRAVVTHGELDGAARQLVEELAADLNRSDRESVMRALGR